MVVVLKKMKVAIDCDGVLCDFIGPYKKWESQIEKDVRTVKSMSINDFWESPPYTFWRYLPEIADADYFREALEGCEITFLTNCPNPKARLGWLKEHGYWSDDCALWCNPAGVSKEEPLKRLRPDLFIDDHDKQIEAAKRAGVPNVHLFVTDESALSWMTIQDLVKDIKRGF